MERDRRILGKQLLITNGRAGKYIDADTFAELACISKKHAYRLMQDPDKISKGIYRLVSMQLLGTIPNWPEGWRIEGDKIYPGGGRPVNYRQVEGAALYMQLEETLLAKINRLQNRVDELEDELRKPRLINSNPRPKRRTLRLATKAVSGLEH